MTYEDALKIGNAVQSHPFGRLSLAERIAIEIMKAYEAGSASNAIEGIGR